MGAEQSTPAGAGQTDQNGKGSDAALKQSPGTPSALVIVGPSGVGKNTLIKSIIEGREGHFGFSISHTARQPRTGEKHGEHYHFTTKEQFAKEIAEGKFLEYADVYGNLYGTSTAAVKSVLDSGRVCILDVDVQGAKSIRQKGIKALFVFIAPPSLEDLARRLASRGADNPDVIVKRLGNAKSEINSVNEKGLYDYLIINDNLQEAVDRLRGISDRAYKGLEAEPGMVPESVVIEDAPLPSFPALNPDVSDVQRSVEQDKQVRDNAAPAANDIMSKDRAPPGADATDAAAPARLRDEPANRAGQRMDMISPSMAAEEQRKGAAPASPSAATSAAVDAGMAKWRGRVALVTGSSSGIGWATCEALALGGVRVVAVARRKERLEALQTHMQKLGILSTHFLPVVCDIKKDAEVATLPRIVAKRWPETQGIEVLVNNAGLSRTGSSLMEGDAANWVEMLSTNVLGTAMVTKAVVQDMQRHNRWGHVINMVGLSGHRIPDGPQGGSFFCATKSAVKSMTEGLRQEARGKRLPLRVSAISPGMVETEFFTVRSFGDEKAAQQATSAFKCLKPEDIAQAVLWCLSAPEHVEVNDIVVRPTEQML